MKHAGVDKSKGGTRVIQGEDEKKNKSTDLFDLSHSHVDHVYSENKNRRKEVRWD